MSLKEDLLSARAYGLLGAEAEQASNVELIETHISWVFLFGSHAFKVKKPVNFGFLDFTSLQARKQACLSELSLNRRLAPGVYRGVVPITRSAGGFHELGGTGELVDYAVQMVRLSDDTRADKLLRQGKFDHEQVTRIAELLAEFHERSDHTQSRTFGVPEVMSENVRENFVQTRATISSFINEEQALELERWQTDFLRDHEGLFLKRANDGRVCEGHGDLRLEHVYLGSSSIDIIDCIEFNERFRYADVAADTAFLAMDLAEHGRVDLAERFLARYALASDDFELYALVDFYESYRAHVRGKISSIIAASPDTDPTTRARAQYEARRYYLLALSASRKPTLAPELFIVAGVIASGKSTISEFLSLELDAPLLQADRARKHLLGAKPEQAMHDAAFSGGYDPEVSERVYAELLRRAALVVGSGRSIIIDASFRSGADRARARDLAERLGARFWIMECRAPREVCLERLKRRERERSISDGRIEIFDSFCARYEPITEFSSDEHIVLDTSLPSEHSRQALRERLLSSTRNVRARESSNLE